MARKLTPVAEQEAEMDRLEAIGRQRALTEAESDQLASLVYRQQQRGYRVDYQLARARRRVSELERRALAA